MASVAQLAVGVVGGSFSASGAAVEKASGPAGGLEGRKLPSGGASEVFDSRAALSLVAFLTFFAFAFRLTAAGERGLGGNSESPLRFGEGEVATPRQGLGGGVKSAVDEKPEYSALVGFWMTAANWAAFAASFASRGKRESFAFSSDRSMC